MEEDVSLLSMDWHVRGSAFGDWIRRCCDILIMLVLGIRLRGIGFDRLG